MTDKISCENPPDMKIILEKNSLLTSPWPLNLITFIHSLTEIYEIFFTDIVIENKNPGWINT